MSAITRTLRSAARAPDDALAAVAAMPVPDPDAVPVLLSRDYSRLRALRWLWRRAEHPAGRLLSGTLERARVVSPDALPATVAALDSRILLAVEGQGTKARVLAMPGDAAAAAGGGGRALPVSTPLGAALLGMEAGQRMETVGLDGRTLAVRLIAVDQRSAGGGQAAGQAPPQR
jgi:regulator of nucleoside diphosphate kinase